MEKIAGYALGWKNWEKVHQVAVPRSQWQRIYEALCAL